MKEINSKETLLALSLDMEIHVFDRSDHEKFGKWTNDSFVLCEEDYIYKITEEAYDKLHNKEIYLKDIKDTDNLSLTEILFVLYKGKKIDVFLKDSDKKMHTLGMDNIIIQTNCYNYRINKEEKFLLFC